MNQTTDAAYIRQMLKVCLEIPSPCGDTEEISQFLKKELEAMGIETRVTNKGAVIGILPGEKEGFSRMVSAHVDTLGAMVKRIKDNGRLRLENVGGYSWTSVEGENVRVKTREGKIFTGTLMPERASVHCFPEDAREEERTADIMEVRLDEETQSKEETLELGIRSGDFVSFETRTVFTESGYIKSRYLDDKACVAALLDACRSLTASGVKPVRTTYVYFTNYEEIGHGISKIPEDTAEILALDIGTAAEGYESDEHCVSICAKDAKTPYDFRLRRLLETLSETEDIPSRTDLYYRYGSDASAAILQNVDARCGCIGPGVDATHHYERTHEDAIINTARLLTAYLLTDTPK